MDTKFGKACRVQALIPFLRAIGKLKLIGESISELESGIGSLFSLPVSRMIIGASEVMKNFFHLDYTLMEFWISQLWLLYLWVYCQNLQYGFSKNFGVTGCWPVGFWL